MSDFDKHFVEMWKFYSKHFDCELNYHLDFNKAIFSITFKSDEERSFFLLHWGDKIEMSMSHIPVNYKLDQFNVYYPEMWRFSMEHFDHSLEYDYNGHTRTFTVYLQSAEEHSFFLLHWNDKIAPV